MTEQLDWVGADSATPRFKDIRNQRPSVAEDKAAKHMELNRLCKTIPPHIKTGGSVNAVREWSAAREFALKVANNKRSSVGELSAAISTMRRFFNGAA